MRFPRLTHRLALGMGAIGLVLASGGAAAAAVSAIQPAGALSAQVPAVGVREQNVNSAGRIRVALPKGSLGVNGSVSVSNLPENSAGRVKVSPPGSSGAQLPQACGSPSSSTQTLLSVSGPGVFHGIVLWTSGASVDIGITVDGQTWMSATGQDLSAGVIESLAAGSPGDSAMGATSGNFHFFPPGGLAFEHSLVITAVNPPASFCSQIWYTTDG